MGHFRANFYDEWTTGQTTGCIESLKDKDGWNGQWNEPSFSIEKFERGWEMVGGRKRLFFRL